MAQVAEILPHQRQKPVESIVACGVNFVVADGLD